MTIQPDNPHPVESTGITEGAGIPADPRDFDLMAPVAFPPGAESAGPWELTDAGRPFRITNTGVIQFADGSVEADDGPELGTAAFLGALATAAHHVQLALEDAGTDAFTVMPADIGITVGIDLTCAVSHLRTASRLLAHAAEGVAS